VSTSTSSGIATSAKAPLVCIYWRSFNLSRDSLCKAVQNRGRKIAEGVEKT